MNRHVPTIGLALLLIGLLWLISSGTVGEVVVVPLLFLWWATQVLYTSIPQALLWGVFVVIAVLVVAKSFPGSSAPLPPVAPATAAPGRVADWSRWLHNAHRDDHSRWRLAQRLSHLAVDTLSSREQCSPQEISRRLDDGSLDIPPQLRAYLRAGSMPYWPKPKQRRRFGWPAQDTVIVHSSSNGTQTNADERGYESSVRVRPRLSASHIGDYGPFQTEPLAIDPQLVIDYLEEIVQHTIGAA